MTAQLRHCYFCGRDSGCRCKAAWRGLCESIAAQRTHWLSSTPQWEHVFATAAKMSDPPSGCVASPHDWDVASRTCKRCKCTSTDWQLGNATMCLDRNPGDTDLTGTCPGCGETYSYWGNASAQVPKCRSCSPVPKAAVDDVAYIRRRIEEIAKEREPVALVDEWAASIYRAAASLGESVVANLMESPTRVWSPADADARNSALIVGAVDDDQRSRDEWLAGMREAYPHFAWTPRVYSDETDNG